MERKSTFCRALSVRAGMIEARVLMNVWYLVLILAPWTIVTSLSVFRPVQFREWMEREPFPGAVFFVHVLLIIIGMVLAILVKLSEMLWSAPDVLHH